MQHTLNSMLIVVTYLFILHITKYRYTGMTVFFLTVYYRPNFPIPRNTSLEGSLAGKAVRSTKNKL